MIKYRLILHVLGTLLLVESAFMLLSVLVSVIYSENDFASLSISTGICLVIGSLFIFLNRKVNKKVEKREAYLIVALGWVVLSLFGALPFYISRYIPSYTDAFFETISGFTTTGATILNDIESLPHGLLFWRSTTQWIGGMGIIVLSIAILPFVKIGGMQLFNAEVPGITTDKLHPRIKQTAKRLWMIYFGFTLAEAVLLYIGGMSVFDAINHSFTTMATGGYSTKQASIAYWNSPYIQYVITAFMFIAGTNFSLSYFLVTGQFKKLINNSELKLYLLIVFGATLIIAFFLWNNTGFGIEESFRDSIFQVVSIITTTGFATADYLTWRPDGLWIILLILMFVGASSGSTAGSIKVVRWHIVFRNSFMEFKRIIHPHAVLPVRYNGSSVPIPVINNVIAFVVLYLIIAAISTVVLSFTGLDFVTALGASATSLGNIGPGFGTTGPSSNFAGISDFAKWTMGFLMLLGRLELFTVLIIFTRAFWRN